jgi:hypothetical protein
MTKNLFVGGPWHGRLIEGIPEGHTQWRVPVRVAPDSGESYVVNMHTVIYELQRFVVSSPRLTRASFRVYSIAGEDTGLLLTHAMALALGLSIVYEP